VLVYMKYYIVVYYCTRIKLLSKLNAETIDKTVQVDQGQFVSCVER
jgi:hypothetical protein